MSAQKASRIVLTINGKRVPLMPGCSIDIGGTERPAVVGDDPQDTGYTEKTKPSKISGDVMLDSSTKLSDLQDAVGIAAVAKLDTGQEYLVTGGWVSETLSVKGGEGKFNLTIMGPPAQEITS